MSSPPGGANPQKDDDKKELIGVAPGSGANKAAPAAAPAAPAPAPAPAPPKKKKRKPKKGDDEKEFYFRLDKIVCTFESAFDKIFLEFEFGGKFKEELVDTGEEVPKKRKTKGADGKETEETYMERVMMRKVKIFKSRAATYFTRFKSDIKPKQQVPFHDHFYEGFWRGTYDDLKQEGVTIKIWHKAYVGPNVLIGKAVEPFSNVVASKIDREIRVLKYVPGAASYRKETMCHMRFKLEFQENFRHNIDFQGWEMRRLAAPTREPKAPLFKCLPNHKSRYLHFEIMQSRRSCMATIAAYLRAYLWPFGRRWEHRCELHMKKSTSIGMSYITYPGTRSWLEDESLSITMTKAICGCCHITIAKKAVELQGVLDYGHIDTVIDVAENMNCMTWLASLFTRPETSQFRLKGTVDSNRVVDGQALPLYRQLGNADPGIGDIFSFLQPESSTFLVVRVVRAKGLGLTSRDEYKETLNPSVTVQWASLTKSSRTCKGTCDPYWDDEVHFKIPDRHTRKKRAPKKFDDFSSAIQQSRIVLAVWDNENFSKSPLGYCHVDFYDVYFGRKKKRIMSFASNGRMVERLVYMSKEQPLIAPFATDGAERKKHKKGAPGGHEEKKDEFATRFIEFMVYFDRTDSSPVPLINKKQKELAILKKQIEKEANAGHAEPLTPAVIKRGRAFWDEALRNAQNREKRLFSFYGKDEYTGNLYFLPTFVRPMIPPTDIRQLGPLCYFIYAMECIRRPEHHIDPSLDPTDPPRGDVMTWSDPFFFLERRKGDVKDHALLLCNFLLGLNRNAYVCVGTARSRGKKPEPHVWVLTLEHDEKTGKNNVRFWETSNGRTYLLEDRMHYPPRDMRDRAFEEQDDPELPEADEDEERRKMDERYEAEERKAMGLAPVEDEAAAEEPAGNNGGKEGGKGGKGGKGKDKDGKNNSSSSSQPQSLAASYVVPQEDKKYKKMTEKAKQQAILQDQMLELEGDDGSEDADILHMTTADRISGTDKSNTGGSGGPEGGIVSEKPDAESARSIFEEQKLAAVENDRQANRYRRNLLSELDVPQYQKQKKLLKRQTPYVSLDVVFNHRHLYANLQHPDPELIKYDFDGHSKRWCEFKKKHYAEYLGIKKLTEFYADKGMVTMKAPQKDAEDIESTIRDRIKDTIRTHRSYLLSMETEFVEKFEFQIGLENDPNANADAYIHKRLENEMEIGIYRPELVALQNSGNGTASNGILGTMVDGFVDGVNGLARNIGLNNLIGGGASDDKQIDYDYIDREWRPTILADLPKDQVYQEQSLQFKHSDANRIADFTIGKCREMFEIHEKQKPRFLVGAIIYRMPASICPVRVFIGVIYKAGD